MAQLINEAKRMQLLAGLINESQLNEVESALQTYLTGISNNLKKKPEILAKEITDYLNSVLIKKDSKTTGEGTFYVVPSRKGAPFLMVMGRTDKSKGFVANEEISNWLAKADPYLVNEVQNEIMKAYIQDTKLTTEKWGGFEKLPNAIHPNSFGTPNPQQESVNIDQAVNEALKAYRKQNKLLKEYDEEGSGYSYEYKEGEGATEAQIKDVVSFYKQNQMIWKNGAEKDFKQLAQGESADIKTNQYPTWKKKDFQAVIKAINPPSDNPSDKPYIMATDKDNDLDFTDELKTAFEKVGANENNFIIYSEFQPNQAHALGTEELLSQLGRHYEIKPRK